MSDRRIVVGVELDDGGRPQLGQTLLKTRLDDVILERLDDHDRHVALLGHRRRVESAQ